MDNTLDQQIRIGALDPEISSIDGVWMQTIDGHNMRISIVGTLPCNLLLASKITNQISQSLGDILCQASIDIEQVE